MDYTQYLTDAEQKAIYAENAANHWGYDKPTVTNYIEKYRTGTDKDKAAIICRFEDVNYHTLCDCLERGDYEGAAAYVNEYWADVEPSTGKVDVPYLKQMIRQDAEALYKATSNDYEDDVIRSIKRRLDEEFEQLYGKGA